MGVSPADDRRLAAWLRDDEGAAEALEREGRLVEAVEYWRATAASFDGLLDVSSARNRVAALVSRPETRQALDDERRWERVGTPHHHAVDGATAKDSATPTGSSLRVKRQTR